MREIKFRAWDKRSKKMLHWGNLLNQQNTLTCLSFEFFKFMQCTGLVDKNGAEIYEGDILKDEENNLWTVEWGKTGYVVFGVELCGNDLLEHGNDYIVVGNIHENPELLPQ